MTDSTTITLLPVSLSIVHLPRSRIHGHFHPLLRQLLLPSPAFLSLTCNELELSLFAEHHLLRDFEPIAKKDARRLLARERGRPSKSRKVEWEPIELSAERWNVLQIDSHSDVHDQSGARIHELSAPLAAAGISILYQSSYMSDFIFVKENRLHEVMSLLGTAGFDLYSSDPDNLTSQVSAFASPMLSPLVGIADEASIHLLDLGSPATVHTISSESGAVFTRSRSSTETSSIAEKSPQLTKDGKSPESRSQSHSPSGCEVRILDPDLTSIGLSDDTADMWTTKIIKLLAFPDMIPGSGVQPRTRSDSISGVLGDTVRVLGTPEIESDSGSQTDDTARGGPYTPRDSSPQYNISGPLLGLQPEKPICEGIFDSDDADGGDEISVQPHLEAPKRPSLLKLDTATTVKHAAQDSPSSESDSHSSPSHSCDPTQSIIPFFSFTRTPEGSSLTASVSLLASLFPPSERHMISCGGELDVLDSRIGSPERSTAGGEADSDVEGEDDSGASTLKCLQIDLRKYGLDKHGLVCRFSRILDENNINHMYSSTYKTANLLVDKASAWRAQSLLRSC
ncbi:hypothetical protein BXZ70DRAFT_908666 [Cristinia sonorae]|uniref:CASTOR ACT domain-containing protein n=1 Tax=Cristinia sonorae TaxID=1940300 RepID=A0A8K0UJX1_9AGAR|nr:hypothetical protein BXZ70DRAFT_908666 [Cristinia sonorae]